MNTFVIAAFPGCGKSYASKNYRGNYFMLDSDSSEYSWVKNDKGEKVRNPEFPQNYINHIKENIGSVDIIFVSTHEQVLDALEENNIDYVLAYPLNTSDNKEKWKRRFVARGNDDAFVDFIMSNWDNFIESMEGRSKPIHFRLGEKIDENSNDLFLTLNALAAITGVKKF